MAIVAIWRIRNSAHQLKCSSECKTKLECQHPDILVLICLGDIHEKKIVEDIFAARNEVNNLPEKLALY